MSIPSCVLCGQTNLKPWTTAKDIEYFTSDKEYSFYECAHCQLLQINPVPENLADIYPGNYYSFGAQKKSLINGFKEWLDKRMFKAILDKLSGNLNVLDVGGGAGWLLNVVKATSSRVKFTQVVDIDADAKQEAVKNGHKYYHGTIESFNTPLTFDFVLMLNLIEHVGDPLGIMQKAEQLLTQQGIILIKTPNYISLDSKLFRYKNWGGLHCPRHWVIFSENSFRLLAEKANLKINYFSFTQGAPFWAVSIIGWLHEKKLVNISAARPIYTHPLYPVLTGIFGMFDLLRKPFGQTSQMFIVLSKK